MTKYESSMKQLTAAYYRAHYGDDDVKASEIRCQIEELEEYRQEVIRAGCDPDDPESHEYKRMGESHTPDGRTIWYQCVKCGHQDSS